MPINAPQESAELGSVRRNRSVLGDRHLDFGCGVGRLTQGPASYFASVRGVDIAPSMIELAKRHNRYPDVCHYDLNCEAHFLPLSNSAMCFEPCGVRSWSFTGWQEARWRLLWR